MGTDVSKLTLAHAFANGRYKVSEYVRVQSNDSDTRLGELTDQAIPDISVPLRFGLVEKNLVVLQDIFGRDLAVRDQMQQLLTPVEVSVVISCYRRNQPLVV